jgi:hypothetical protein
VICLDNAEQMTEAGMQKVHTQDSNVQFTNSSTSSSKKKTNKKNKQKKNTIGVYCWYIKKIGVRNWNIYVKNTLPQLSQSALFFLHNEKIICLGILRRTF